MLWMVMLVMDHVLHSLCSSDEDNTETLRCFSVLAFISYMNTPEKTNWVEGVEHIAVWEPTEK